MLKDIVPWVREHHERFDGTGYPQMLKGEDISLGGRIIALADCYDAMTSDRSYRAALPQEVALAEIEKGRGSQFDPYLAAVWLKLGREDNGYKIIRCKGL